MAIGARPTSNLTPKALLSSSRNFESVKRSSIYGRSWLKRQFLGGPLSIKTKSKSLNTPLRNSVKCSVSEATEAATGTLFTCAYQSYDHLLVFNCVLFIIYVCLCVHVTCLMLCLCDYAVRNVVFCLSVWEKRI